MDLLVRTDWLVIVIYFLAMIGVAWWVSDKSRDAEGYTVAHRDMTGWVLGMSVLGTFTSSITFLALPTDTYQRDWTPFAFGLGLPVAAFFATRYFIPLYRRKVHLSAYELMERRFGYWARAYADVSFLVLQLLRSAMVIMLVAMALGPVLDLHVITTICFVGVVIIIYDVVGGIRADIWTDVIQVFILVGGALWCLATLMINFPGGVTEFIAQIPPEKISFNSFASWDLGQATFLVIFLYGVSENVRNYSSDQTYIQRMLAAESEAAAAKSIWIGAISYLPVSIIFCLIGTGLHMHYSVGMGELPAGMNANQVFPHFIRHELSPAVSGLIVSAILAAAMSTVDSSLNSGSTILLVDVVRRWFGGRELPLREITFLRLSTILLGVFATGLSATVYLLSAENSETVMQLWWRYAGTAGGGLFGLFLYVWLMPKLPSWIAVLGVISTVPVLYWGTFMRDESFGWLRCPLNPNLVGIAATLTMVAVGAAGLFLVKAGMIRANPRSSDGQ